MKLVGFESSTTYYATVQRHEIEFQKEGNFCHPNPLIINGLRNRPELFEHFPSAEADVSKFMIESLAAVSVEMLRSELISSIIPKLVDEANQKGVSHDVPEYTLFCQYTDKPPPYMTVWRWLD